MSSEKVWVSNVIRTDATDWFDYEPFVEEKIDAQLLLQYENLLSKEEREKIKSNYDRFSANALAMIKKFREKKE